MTLVSDHAFPFFHDVDPKVSQTAIAMDFPTSQEWHVRNGAEVYSANVMKGYSHGHATKTCQDPLLSTTQHTLSTLGSTTTSEGHIPVSSNSAEAGPNFDWSVNDLLADDLESICSFDLSEVLLINDLVDNQDTAQELPRENQQRGSPLFREFIVCSNSNHNGSFGSLSAFDDEDDYDDDDEVIDLNGGQYSLQDDLEGGDEDIFSQAGKSLVERGRVRQEPYATAAVPAAFYNDSVHSMNQAYTNAWNDCMDLRTSQRRSMIQQQLAENQSALQMLNQFMASMQVQDLPPAMESHHGARVSRHPGMVDIKHRIDMTRQGSYRNMPSFPAEAAGLGSGSTGSARISRRNFSSNSSLSSMGSRGSSCGRSRGSSCGSTSSSHKGPRRYKSKTTRTRRALKKASNSGAMYSSGVAPRACITDLLQGKLKLGDDAQEEGTKSIATIKRGQSKGTPGPQVTR